VVRPMVFQPAPVVTQTTTGTDRAGLKQGGSARDHLSSRTGMEPSRTPGGPRLTPTCAVYWVSTSASTVVAPPRGVGTTRKRTPPGPYERVSVLPRGPRVRGQHEGGPRRDHDESP
jgi:hypothetical protein